MSSGLDRVQAGKSRPARPVPDLVLPGVGQRVFQGRRFARENLRRPLPRCAQRKSGSLPGHFGITLKKEIT